METKNFNLELLKESSVGTETIPYKKKFTSEEKTAMRESQLGKLIDKDTIEEELAAYNKIQKQKIKTLSTEALKERKQLKDGFNYENRLCYLVPVHETGYMHYIDSENGDILFERKLTPDEKQLRITDNLKIA